MAKFTGTKGDLQALAALVNKSESRPLKGTKVGGGTHVDIPDVYTPGAPGWLQQVTESGGELQCDADKLTALTTATALTPAEKTQAATLISQVTVT